MKIRNGVESENIKCFSTIFNGEAHPNKDEISEGRYWTNDQITKGIGEGAFTPAFAAEFQRLSACSVKVGQVFRSLLFQNSALKVDEKICTLDL